MKQPNSINPQPGLSPNDWWAWKGQVNRSQLRTIQWRDRRNDVEQAKVEDSKPLMATNALDLTPLEALKCCKVLADIQYGLKTLNFKLTSRP